MNPVTEFIASGILELYVMGAASPEDVLAVEKMAAAHPEVKQEIEQISLAMEHYAQTHAVKPRATVKTLVMATIDYLERMKHGELPESPPVLTPASCVSDYEKWLHHPDAMLPDDAEGIYARIIGYTPTATTAIIWIREMTEPEMHHDEYERFLILEGTCNFKSGEQMHPLQAGDFFSVPLHTPHFVEVTSDIPCKAILQRLSVE
ncbi:mannose-6-phosphate isomerase-like protein (cupin superfamily) [Pontibacter aydingkolensis]|uniref:Cupin domain-containing protein n=1 Tax=Pontibacter aydingkolensis TaxID=1911536 RepID=A0ABS7CZ98_9BACT|nr:cupin domain-containing protein [Pontibacter aydingkolensis]MBW7469184.1 cupin domain-containing protein [Pontibacter aydingkolensis]